jgi:hypothetical protein
MSYQLFVYARSADTPSIDDISGLLDVAGWQWVPVTDMESFRRAATVDGAIALGWDLADDIGDSVLEAVTHENADLVTEPLGLLCAVEVSMESPFDPGPDVVSELRESDFDPDLVTRVEEAAACYVFRADGRVTEQTVEFMWSLASAVGVLTDGVLEDVEDGSLLDCTDDGEDRDPASAMDRVRDL